VGISLQDLTAVILAGGRGRRMGGSDKGLVELEGRPLIAHVLNVIAPQVGTVLINANRNAKQYEAFGYPVVSDTLDGFQGPLAGFASAMAAATTPYILTLPCDGPLVPPDYAARMIETLEIPGSEIAVAHDGNRMQPVYALLPVRLTADLEGFLAQGDRKIDLWYARHRTALANFSDRPDAFRNINTPQDRDQLQKEVAVT
jgi:molybdenum cofactor guanylyltransferase